MCFRACILLHIFWHNKTDKEILPGEQYCLRENLYFTFLIFGWNGHRRGWAS